MLPYRDVVRYDLVLFGPEEDDTKDVLDFIQKNLGWAVRTGLLRVATYCADALLELARGEEYVARLRDVVASSETRETLAS